MNVIHLTRMRETVSSSVIHHVGIDSNFESIIVHTNTVDGNARYASADS